MFGFFDNGTPETARRLFDRARQVERKYLHLSMATLAEQVAADLPESMNFVSPSEASFSFENLPEFSFSITGVLDGPVFTIFGGGRFSGFMLQRAATGESWHTDVQKPAAFPLGSKAHRLAASFQQQFGVSNLSEFRRRLHFQVGLLVSQESSRLARRWWQIDVGRAPGAGCQSANLVIEDHGANRDP